MKNFKCKTIKIVSLLLFVLIPIYLFSVNINFSKFGINNNETAFLNTNSTYEWLRNNDFSSEEYWSLIEGNSGDNSTVEAFIDQGAANFRVIGEYQYNEFSDSLNDGTWNKTRNENFLFPDIAENRSYGLFVSHDYNEAVNQTRQYHSVHWKKIVDSGLDMSKYTIKNATLGVIFNATVSTNLEVLGEGSRYTVGDFARFYVYISDIGESNRYRVAYNRTIALGYNSSYTTILDTLLETVGQNDIIQGLEAAFEKDPLHKRALLTIGIDVYCEDNEGTDRDIFTSLIIKSLNLTFSSVRSIEKFTTVSLIQISDSLNQDNIQVINAKLAFKHKINQLWPSDLSAFSELRIYFNENQFKDTIQLSSINNSLQEAKIGGYDVTNLILKKTNISLSIQFFIANNFGLDSNRTISIDDVYLKINYVFLEPETNMLPLIFGLSGGIAGVCLFFILYQTVFKYPAKVRKIRKLRKKIRKGKTMKALKILNRNEIIKKNYYNEIDLLNLEKEKNIIK